MKERKKKRGGYSTDDSSKQRKIIPNDSGLNNRINSVTFSVFVVFNIISDVWQVASYFLEDSIIRIFLWIETLFPFLVNSILFRLICRVFDTISIIFMPFFSFFPVFLVNYFILFWTFIVFHTSFGIILVTVPSACIRF